MEREDPRGEAVTKERKCIWPYCD
ncbi:hypothetical protein HKBW3S06_01688, partial [Candidatus Hakubella thermalkaliphila]